jgi:hypothetical protein
MKRLAGFDYYKSSDLHLCAYFGHAMKDRQGNVWRWVRFKGSATRGCWENQKGDRKNASDLAQRTLKEVAA